MNTNPLNQADQALRDRLAQITPSNGYFTDVGTRVRFGFAQQVIDDEEAAYPTIVIQPDETPPPTLGATQWAVQLGRKVIALADPSDPDETLATLNDVFADLLRALMVPEGTVKPWGSRGPYKVTFKASNQLLPDTELPKGVVAIPLLLWVVLG
ncbi:hypothetical protein IB274_02410 [Pseudomonas sp. PDM18]|uniref:hypothetical protein n=1 Tax=Pseudomonas sp. PDM18 TaxID=2769253 RepID=UPI0017867D59|nr:hypothetical protein [Pseudomonas sp. PDM18]MBD9675531.1 hypothetical protein [Pseudomonas sp. PDM18]